METGRAKKESTADQVLSTSAYEIMEKLKRLGKPEAGISGGAQGVSHGPRIDRIGVPRGFPAGIFQHLVPDFEVKIPVESPATRVQSSKDRKGDRGHNVHPEGL